jgi:hypothetical protein
MLRTQHLRHKFNIIMFSCTGLPDGTFSKENNLGKFWRATKWKRLVFFTAICNILLQLGMYILWPLCNFVTIWCIFPRFGTYCVKKNLETLLLYLCTYILSKYVVLSSETFLDKLDNRFLAGGLIATENSILSHEPLQNCHY